MGSCRFSLKQEHKLHNADKKVEIGNALCRRFNQQKALIINILVSAYVIIRPWSNGA